MTTGSVNDRRSCIVCGGELFNMMLNLGDSPLANDFRRNRDEALELERFPLELIQCAGCMHVQLGYSVPDEKLWQGECGFYSSASSVVVAHSQAYADWIMSTMPKLARRFVVEIAANDGVLLAPLRQHGARVLGIDPAAGPVGVARGRGLEMRQQQFGAVVAQDVIEANGKASLILANNVIAHVEDLHDFMLGVDRLLAPDGYFVLEFQYLGDLLAGNQIDHVYHEHRSYFSLHALAQLISPYDLKILSAERIEMQGGSLRVVMARAGWPDHSVRAIARTEEAWIGLAHQGLQQRAEHIRNRLRDMLWRARHQDRIVAGYGASAKSTTLLNFCKVESGLISYFVDSTPTKVGRFTPGTGIPIVSPESDSRMPDIYLLAVWNYAREIMRRERGHFKGEWLVPIPVPVLL